jgi:hypothetical protein
MDDVTIGRTEANGQHTDKHELANMLKGRSDMVEVIEYANFSRQDKMLMRRSRSPHGHGGHALRPNDLGDREGREGRRHSRR